MAMIPEKLLQGEHNSNIGSATGDDRRNNSHVAMFPSAGMGHFMPFLHLARVLAANCGFSVTFITTKGNVSPSETAHVQGIASWGLDIRVVQLEIRSLSSEGRKDDDPFLAQWEAIGRSMEALEELLVTDLLNSSASRPPISAIITDPALTPSLHVTAKLKLPNYILFTASAFTLGFVLYAPVLVSQGYDFSDEELILNIPAFPPLPTTQIAQALKNKSHIFYKVFISSGTDFPKFSGILVNTFSELEAPFLDALRSGKVMEGLPPVYPIGPLFLPSMSMKHSNTLKLPLNPDQDDDDDTAKRCLQWLDLQPARSVVYVSFGSRSAMSVSQIAELAAGLEGSGQRFFWLLSTSVVASKGFVPSTVLPLGFESRVGNRGMVVSSWVPQVAILSHGAIGAFVSHCGWNSVVESVCCGVPIVAWPLFGDQMMNARLVVENAKVGVEVNKGKDGIVSAEEVKRVVKCVMELEGGLQMRKKAAGIRRGAPNEEEGR
jgi:UDP:flavonoid glycosyltransferase YjiC (YdhE family)